MDTGQASRDAFRRWGYLQARLDPLGRLEPHPHPELEAAGGGAERWRRIYCGPIGAEFMHMIEPERVAWVAERMETEPPEPDRRFILRRLAEAEVLERFLHRIYVGTKRYSLEGSSALVPLLDALLEGCAGNGASIVLIGMSHRGRLNVMVNVVGVEARRLFANFEDGDPRSVLGGGDVRYHLGATGDYRTREGRILHLHLVSNPSHLEAVDPVLMGRARARQTRIGGAGARDAAVPICIHGDAALAGQGVAAETLNMDGIPGFGVGGTVHVVVDNLIGFTTPPRGLHGSRHAADVARRLSIPIFHVDGSDPEAVARVGAMAIDYRARFHTDVMIDMIGFRRYGHSEVDDPTMTQPRLYRAIEELPLLYESYGDRIGVSDAERESLRETIEARLSRARDEGRDMHAQPVFRTLPDYWEPYRGGAYDAALEVETGVEPGRLRRIAGRLAEAPGGFNVHPRVARIMEQRAAMASGERDVDWGMAEALAFGTLLVEGTPVRLSGEDTRRGTFNQRHSVLIDERTEAEHVPLRHLGGSQAAFEILDTPLSEAAALGYEYGYSRDTPEALVCWEAQFGDFANGGQVIIDQFISSGEDKWGLLSGLVLLLPHGYEGQGPEHSSARLERFLQLAAEDNIQICQPSTAAQYFHLLRRQALRRWRKPLVILTPKGLLRSARVASPLELLAAGRFATVIPDDGETRPRRMLVATGMIVHALREAREKRRRPDIAIVAVEQLYPFPEREIADALARSGSVEEVVWVQEEPANMGALAYIRPRMERLAGGRPVTTVHRSESASAATGSAKAHHIEHEALIGLAMRA